MKDNTKITLTLKQIKKLVKESAVKEDSFDVVDDPTVDQDKPEENVKKWYGDTKCDFCHRDCGKTLYDGMTGMGPWAVMCEPCFHEYGVGLGPGKGQKYKKVGNDYVKVEKKPAAKRRRRDASDWEREFFPELFSEGRKSKVTFGQLKRLVKESIPNRDRWNNLMDVKNEAWDFFVDKYNNGDNYGEFHAGTYSSLLANIEYDGWKVAGTISGDDDLVIYVNEDGVYCCTQFEEDEDDEDGCFWYCEFVQLDAEMVDKLRDAGIID